MIERALVVGAGAIGSLYAAHLATVCETWVLVRRDEHAAALEADGLRVTGKHELVGRVRATADPAELPDVDLAIVATKALHVDEAAARLAGRIPGASVMTVQNGLGAEELVRRHGAWPLISAVTFMSGRRHGDAEVQYELDTPTWMGPYAGAGASFDDVVEAAEIIARAGLVVEAMPDLLPAQWSKLIFNATVNAVAALTDLPHNSLFADTRDDASLGHLVRALVEEGTRVAAAVGVPLHDDPWEMNVRAVSRGESDHGDYQHLPSMLEDVRARRPTEIDQISGALVREARRVGVEAPLHEALWRLVRAREASWAPRREEVRA